MTSVNEMNAVIRERARIREEMVQKVRKVIVSPYSADRETVEVVPLKEVLKILEI